MIDDTHVGPEDFPHNPYDPSVEIWKRRSLAYWAKEPNGTVIVFVHGWSGSATSTWMDFAELWPESKKHCDLIFYGYASVFPQVHGNADDFRHFLKEFAQTPVEMVNSTLSHLDQFHRNSDEFQLTKLIIVAHSLGAVIARRALLDAREEKAVNSWLEKTQLLLFAPAHLGSRWAEIPVGARCATAIARGVAVWALQSLRSLKPKCDYLNELETDTLAVISDGAEKPFKASRVVFPSNDMIVEVGKFGEDQPNERPFQGRSHKTVCKPTADWRKPIELIEKEL